MKPGLGYLAACCGECGRLYFLTCAVAVIEGFAVYFTDKDFEGYRRYIPVKLY